MPNKPSLVINISPLVALAAALDDFQVLDDDLVNEALRLEGLK